MEPIGKAGLSLKAKIIIAVCIGVAVIALAVGLGVGLSGKSDSEDTVTSTTSRGTTTTTIPTTPTVTTGPGPWDNIRLPANIIPSHYDLTLQPNLDDDTFTGNNMITMEVNEPTRYVIIHAHPNLRINSAMLTDKDGGNINITDQFRVNKHHYYVMDVGENNNLQKGIYMLVMEFNSFLNYTLSGLYTSTYKDDAGNEFKIMSSDMEPSDARRAYPCFDEPAMKIRYTTTIIHQSKYSALSNMDVDNITANMPSNGWTTTRFRESVVMPTYLGAFAVSEYDFVEDTTNSGVKTRIYAAKHDIAAGRANWAIEMAVKIMEAFEDRLGLEYQLPKCDHIAIPDFTAGAMENWGLITYREPYLLWDPNESSAQDKQNVAFVIAHELAHMWFGNLVTMEWWHEIWLNEGFANYFQHIGVEAVKPEFGYMLQQVVGKQSIMRGDSSISSKPLVRPYEQVQTPAESASVFSSITYTKGGTVLAMMRENIGDSLFFGGLNNYLSKHQYGNTATKDLWSSMQEYADNNGGTFNFTEMMNPWIYQNGFPLLNVSLVGTNQLMISQQQMISDPYADLSLRVDSPYDYIWPVNIKLVGNEIATHSDGFVLKGVQATVDLTTDNGLVLKLNPQQMNLYRVKYDANSWEKIINFLKTNHTALHAADRANLVDDALQLASAEIINYSDALEITTYLDKENEDDSLVVWDAFGDGFGYIRVMLESTSLYPKFKEYTLSKVKPIADVIGWESGTGEHMHRLNRYRMLALALRYGDVEAESNATNYLETWKNTDVKTFDSEVHNLVYRYGHGDGADGVERWNFLLQKYRDELVASEKDALLLGLTQSQNADLLSQLLEYTKNTSVIKEGDVFNCLIWISYTALGRNLTWDWFTTNWQDMLDRFGEDNRWLGIVAQNIVYYFNTQEMYDEVEGWFDVMSVNVAGESSRTNGLNQIKENIIWMNDNLQDISDWLDTKI